MCIGSITPAVAFEVVIFVILIYLFRATCNLLQILSYAVQYFSNQRLEIKSDNGEFNMI